MAPRSGTTFLGDLLALHPGCELPDGVPEDGLLGPLGHLDRYVGELERFWESWPDVSTPERDEVFRGIGSGLGAMLLARASGEADVVVTKTPFPANLDRIGALFPDSRGVVIVRDGRSVVESTVRTWGSPFDVAAARFRDGARSILDAIGSINHPPAHLRVVRYEDLYADTVQTALDVVDFFGLDTGHFPVDSVDAMPVRGSSTISTAADGDVHWDAVDKPADFAPTERWSSWTDHQHELFAAIAGAENRAFGYESVEVSTKARGLDAALGARRRVVDALPPTLRDRLSGRT